MGTHKPDIHLKAEPKKNILLITPAAPDQTPFSTSEKRPPLGIGYLISVLRRAGHNVFFIDNYLKPSNFLNTNILQKNRIDFVGIYANTICLRDTLRILHKLQFLRYSGKWNGKILIGGPHVCVAPDTIPDFVDHIVQGEGENAIIDIVEGRAKERFIRYPRIDDLDMLPLPAWDYFTKLPYDWGVQWFPEKPVFTMNTSRGCPFGCSFCSVRSIWGRKYTCFSAERVVTEIEFLIEKYGAKGIYFREDNFTANPKRLVKFCNLLLEKGIDLPWACETRVDSLDRQIVELMHRAGARAFYFGIESGSQRILDFLNKGITVEQIRNAFRYCREFGIKTAASIMIGVPKETAHDINETQKLLEDIRPSVIWHNVFVGIPHSPLYEYVIENKLYAMIDDRGLVYLKEHNELVRVAYKDAWNAYMPIMIGHDHKIVDPEVSVIMAVHNGERFLERAVKSILSQSLQNFELIIIDDASTDRTADILAKYDDPRIITHRNSENCGPAGSRNRATQLARGKYIAVMDADDISLPHRLATQVEFLERNPDVALVGSCFYEIGEDDRVRSLVNVLTDHRAIREGLLDQNWFGHSTAMIRKEVMAGLGGYDERFKYAHDYELFLRMSEHYKLANIAEPLCYWRFSPESISYKKKDEQKYFARLAVSEAKKRRQNKTGVSICEPLVSVIVPTLNRPDMLVETLKSILNQTFRDFEIIIVNDGGADVEDRVKALNMMRNITYVRHEKNRGLAAARNTGIRLARGKYIAYLDDDDIYYPDHLETMVSCLESSDFSVAYTDAHRMFQEKQNGSYQTVKKDILYSFDFDYMRILKENFIPVLCVVHEKSCLDKVGLFDETLRSHEDWDLWMRMSRKFKFAHIPKVTCAFTWRQDGSTMTSGQRNNMIATRDILLNRGRKFAEMEVFLADSRVSIVIPVFNKVDFTRKCLAALSRNTPRGLYECIIVDNASTDGTGEYLKSLGDEIKVITNQSNLGFAKACNQGARAAAASYILFLNNDTEPQPGWLEPLVEILDRDASAAAVGSKMLFPDGTIQHAGVLILDDRKLPDPLVARHIYYNQPSDFREANESRLYQALTAACLLIRRGAFEAVGGFDEGYWNGYEDIDFCFKLQEKGWRLAYQPRSVLIHHESKSGSERFTKVRENIIRLHSRWLGRIRPDAVIEKDGSFQWTNAGRIQTYKIPKGESIAEHSEGQRDLVSIVILTFNELAYTKRCVESIRKNTPEPHEIIFVDNGSKDGTAKWLRKLAKVNPNYRLIENRENFGFARGCNQGIEASKGEYILLLNNDVLVTEGWLPGMLAHLNSAPDIGIVGPMTNNISGIQKAEGVTYKSADDLETYACEFRDRNRYRRVASRRLVGFCMLFRRSLVNEIGPLDESFGTGNFEDDDFCLRAALAGYRNVIAGDVFIHHFGSRSFIGNRINYGTSLTGNRKIFDHKWRGAELAEGQGRRCLALKNVEEARGQYQLGRLNKAVDLYLEAIKSVPSETKIYQELAEILIQSRNFKDALAVLREIPADSGDARSLVLEGFSREGLNEDDEANALAERTLEYPQTRSETLNLKGILAYKKQSLEEAAAFFRQAIEADPSYGEAHTNLGVVRWKEAKEAEALPLLEKGFILAPDHADVANLYHSAAKNLGQLERAEAIFREAKGIHFLNRSIAFLLIDLLMSMEKFAEAMGEIERAMGLFEIDEGFLKAALDIRSKVGPLEPAEEKKDQKTISLCMIVKNEDKNLLRCLSTMKPAVDEIIVADTGSSDRTKDIAAAFGAKVFDVPWRDDFSEARNISLSKATCDWILVLDADEVISPCDFVKLRKLSSTVRGQKTGPGGFILTTRNYSSAMNTEGWLPNDGSYTNEEAGPGWYPSRKVRLLRNDPRIRFKGAVHELVEDSMIRHSLKIHSSDIPVHHHGSLQAKDGVNKSEIYYQLGKKKIDESRGDARAIYELAIQTGRLHKYDEAIRLWLQFLDSNSEEDLHLAYMNLGHVYLETGRYEEAAKACKKALEIDPELKEAHLNLAMSEFYMGRPKEAAAILDNLIRKIPEYIPAWALLAATLILIGETDQYSVPVDRMRKNDTNPAVFFQAYAEKLLSAGREEDGARLLETARSIWRDILKSRGLEATDEEIERIMVIAAGESPTSEGGLEEITNDPGRQEKERTQRAPSPRPE